MKKILLMSLTLLSISCSNKHTLQLNYEPFTGKLRHTFSISTYSRDTTPIVLTQISYGDYVGYGEAALPQYLKETQESVCAFLEKAVSVVAQYQPDEIDQAMAAVQAIAPDNRAAKAAIDIALHDLYGKIQGKPLWQIWNIDPEKTPYTCYTIGYDANDSVVLAKTKEADWAHILKVKLGRSEEDDKRMIRLIRQCTDKPIYVDANQGWPDREYALDMILWLQEQGVVMVEQPMAKDNMPDHKWLTERSPLPIIADEACQQLCDVEKLKGIYHGINIKLMKCGGMGEARKMIALARELGMQVMIGCMTETSAGISAAATLSPLVDYADLDGNVLISNDPYEGVQLTDGKQTLINRPGTGCQLKK